MLFRNFIIPFLIAATTVTAFLDITTSLTKYASFDFGVGDISISKGASFSLINQFDAVFQGGLTIEKGCDFFLASKVNVLKVVIDKVFAKVVNKGLWVILTIEATKECIINIAGAKLENIGNLICAIEAKKLLLSPRLLKILVVFILNKINVLILLLNLVVPEVVLITQVLFVSLIIKLKHLLQLKVLVVLLLKRISF